MENNTINTGNTQCEKLKKSEVLRYRENGFFTTHCSPTAPRRNRNILHFTIILPNWSEIQMPHLKDIEMNMSTTAHRGLMASAYLAEHADEGLVVASTISEKYDIPLESLFQILKKMVKMNILRSKKGPKGGFALARPAKEITLLEIIESVDGQISTQLEIVELTKKAPFSVEMEKVCERAYEKAVSILSRAKLSQMVG